MRAKISLVELLCPALLSLIQQQNNSHNQRTENNNGTMPNSSAENFDFSSAFEQLMGDVNCVRLFQLLHYQLQNQQMNGTGIDPGLPVPPSPLFDPTRNLTKRAEGTLEDDQQDLSLLPLLLANESNLIINDPGEGVFPPAQKMQNDQFEGEAGAEEECYPAQTRILMSFIFASLSLVGIVGNVLVVVVVRKVPGMITPTNCYLVSLAISDCLFFVAAAPTELSYLHVPCTKYAFGAVGCSIFSYLPYLAINSSSMSITAFTVERFIGICYPLRARYICTVKRAKLIICMIWLFCIIYNSPWLYLAALKVDESGEVFCGFRNDRDDWAYKVMYLSDFIFWYSIPMILNIFIYIQISCTLSRCPQDLMKQSSGGEYSTSHSPAVGANSSLLSRDSHSPLYTLRSSPSTNGREFFVNSGKNAVKAKFQVIKMLAVVVIVFAVCWLPYRAMVMYNSFVSSEGGIWNPDWYIFLSKTMIFINCAVNPILYNLMSKRFRSAFRRLLNKDKYAEELRRPQLNSLHRSNTRRRTFTKQMSVDDQLLAVGKPAENSFQISTPILPEAHSECWEASAAPLLKQNGKSSGGGEEVSTAVTLLLSANGIRPLPPPPKL